MRDLRARVVRGGLVGAEVDHREAVCVDYVEELDAQPPLGRGAGVHPVEDGRFGGRTTAHAAGDAAAAGCGGALCSVGLCSFALPWRCDGELDVLLFLRTARLLLRRCRWF